jgi:hypothetical protein
MAVSQSPAIEAHLHAAERRMIDLFALRPRDLPPGLGAATGRWKDSPVTITTRAYEGDAVSYMRVAMVSGMQVTLGSLLVVPRPNRPVPLLDAELSWSGARGEVTIVADLMPVRDALERHSAPALHARVTRAEVRGALAAFDGYVNAFVQLLGAASPSPERASHVRALHESYMLAHRGDESLAILGTMFGRTWADDYIARALFPVS